MYFIFERYSSSRAEANLHSSAADSSIVCGVGNRGCDSILYTRIKQNPSNLLCVPVHVVIVFFGYSYVCAISKVISGS